MEVEQVAIGELVLDARNPRRGDVQAIQESLRQFGQHRPVVAQRSTKRVLIGNHMLMAAGALGWERIGVHWVDDDDLTAQRRALADNLVADRSSMDDAQLTVLLRELDEGAASLPGVDDRMLDRLLADLDVDSPDAPPAFPIVPKPGEAYAYVVVVSDNEIDGLWLREVLGAREMRSYKSDKVAASRVITVSMFKDALNRAIKRGAPFT